MEEEPKVPAPVIPDGPMNAPPEIPKGIGLARQKHWKVY